MTDTVAAPLEQQINGVEKMVYMSSTSSSNGSYSLTVTFEVGTDLEEAEELVQNHVALADPTKLDACGLTSVNDFNKFGRTYRVTLQADSPFRDSVNDVRRLNVRNADGETFPGSIGIDWSGVSDQESQAKGKSSRYSDWPSC